jgi:signal transduction histidine kinase/CheY-like chemotaxis protein
MLPSPSFAEAAPAARSDSYDLRRWVTASGITLILLIIGADSYEAWQDYRRVISDNDRAQAALCRSVAEQAARLIGEADVLLAGYVGGGDAAQLQREIDRARRMPFVASASIIDAGGRIVADTRAASVGGMADAADVGDGMHVDELHIEVPDMTAPAATRTFALRRPIRTADGGFAGVGVVRIASEYLAQLYARININHGTLISLQRADGRVLARLPEPAEREIDRIEITQPVEGYPLSVSVSRARSSVLRPWVSEERSSAARTLSLTVLAALLLLALRRALARQLHTERERRQLQQELGAAQRVEALGFLAAAVAHDFNNVLTAIVGYAELARESTLSDPHAERHIERLLAATERARMLVRRVLTFDPHRSLQYLPVHVEPIVQEVAEQLRTTLPRPLKLEVEEMQGTSIILGDATEVYQVALNLGTNAVHAMPNGGTLRISLTEMEIESPHAVTLGRLDVGRWVALTIADGGVGMSVTQMSSMFEPFYTTRQAGQGTGIGLAVVRNIILRMNGALDVDSRLEGGTRMTAYWPALSAPMVTGPGGAVTPAGAGETIMVVDDEPELVALTEDLLASLSYEPVGFSDARAALEALQKDPARFHAVLTDERMQPLRGLDLAAEIQKLRPGLPIILMTGHRDEELDRRAAAVGIVEILDKPLRINTLRSALARRLNRAT